jgi:hypothetical protein
MGDMKTYTAKPYFNTNKQMREFDTPKEAAKYLLEVTGFKMPADEWELIGKIIVKETENA